MVAGEVEAELKQWLKLAVSLEEVLDQPEPDPELVASLLAERSAVQARVARLVEQAGGPRPEQGPEVAELVEAILASDRRAMQRAEEIRAESMKRLEDVRKRREMAAGYRRALQGVGSDGPAFCDKFV